MQFVLRKNNNSLPTIFYDKNEHIQALFDDFYFVT